MPPWWLPPLLLLVLALGEWPTWRGYRKRWAPSAQDGGTVGVNSLLGNLGFVAGLASGAALRGVPATLVPAWLAWAGIPVALAGTALRLWAILTLGPWFTMTIQVQPGQPVVDRGPYRLLRHPSYAGGDLAFVGIGLSAGNWLSPLLYLVPWVAAHVHRIGVEERALAATLGEPYRAYQRRTWRLVPLVW